MPARDALDDLHLTPGHLIRRLQQSAVAVVISTLAENGYDLTPVQYAALKALSIQPGLDQATLAGLIHHDRTTIGGVIDRLAQKGLVDREISPTDRRARVLTLSSSGRETLTSIEPLVLQAQNEILGGLEEAERPAFLISLQKCVDALADRSRVPKKDRSGE